MATSRGQNELFSARLAEFAHQLVELRAHRLFSPLPQSCLLLESSILVEFARGKNCRLLMAVYRRKHRVASLLARGQARLKVFLYMSAPRMARLLVTMGGDLLTRHLRDLRCLTAVESFLAGE